MDDSNAYYSAKTGIYLYPTQKQREFLDKTIEGYKIVYNWSLQMEYNQYSLYLNGKTDRSFLSFFDLALLYRTEFRKSSELLASIPDHSMLNAIKDMVKGYESFLKHKSTFNKPELREKDGLFSHFRPRSETTSFYFNDNYLRIEGLPYKDMIETSFHTGNHLSDNIRYYNPIIKRNNRTGEYILNYITKEIKLDGYFIEHNIAKSEPIGVDVNKNILYACSNGLAIYNRNVDRIIKHLADAERAVTKDRNNLKLELESNPEAKLSNNALFRLEKARKIYNRLFNIHKDTAYKGALQIVRLNPEAVIIESLEIKKIMSHNYIAKNTQFFPLGTAQRILQEQCFKYNIPVVFAPPYFESSNYCSNCGFYKNTTGECFICPNCGSRIQRDINAAINLRKWYTGELKITKSVTK